MIGATGTHWCKLMEVVRAHELQYSCIICEVANHSLLARTESAKHGSKCGSFCSSLILLQRSDFHSSKHRTFLSIISFQIFSTCFDSFECIDVALIRSVAPRE